MKDRVNSECKWCLHWQAGSCPGSGPEELCEGWEPALRGRQLVAAVLVVAGVIGMLVCAVLAWMGGRA